MAVASASRQDAARGRAGGGAAVRTSRSAFRILMPIRPFGCSQLAARETPAPYGRGRNCSQPLGPSTAFGSCSDIHRASLLCRGRSRRGLLCPGRMLATYLVQCIPDLAEVHCCTSVSYIKGAPAHQIHSCESDRVRKNDGGAAFDLICHSVSSFQGDADKAVSVSDKHAIVIWVRDHERTLAQLKPEGDRSAWQDYIKQTLNPTLLEASDGEFSIHGTVLGPPWHCGDLICWAGLYIMLRVSERRWAEEWPWKYPQSVWPDGHIPCGGSQVPAQTMPQ